MEEGKGEAMAGINTVRKGGRNQNKARKYYESLGYEVEVVRRDRWRPNQDFFGLWDLICVSFWEVLFVQVKTNRKPEKEWVERAKKWLCPLRAKKICIIYKDYQRGNKPSVEIVYDPCCSDTD